MRGFARALAVVVGLGVWAMGGGVALGEIEGGDIILRRGDANSDGIVDGSDVTTISEWLFNSGLEPPCLNQADVNGDGRIDGSDPIYLSSWLWQGGAAPPTPGPFNSTCTQTTDEISCSYPPCSL